MTGKSRSVRTFVTVRFIQRLITAPLGIPDAEARLSILGVLLSKTPHDVSQDDLRSIASRAHGYVGADLSAVVREAGTIAIKRWISSQRPIGPASSDTLKLTLDDLASSLPTIRPSAMRSLFLDTPPIRYSDIGGQASAIQKLREAVEWPLLHPETFARLGVRPPKGVLLYGPPGCSKTILVRACACESGVNFVAVKGPEVSLMDRVYPSDELTVSYLTAIEQICWRVRARRPRDLPQSESGSPVHHILCSYSPHSSRQLVSLALRTKSTH